MDASHHTNYVLALLFVKYVSEKHNEHAIYRSRARVGCHADGLAGWVVGSAGGWPGTVGAAICSTKKYS